VVVLGICWNRTWDGPHLKNQTFFLTFKPNIQRIHDLNIIIFTSVIEEHMSIFPIYFVLSSEMSVYLLKSAFYWKIHLTIFEKLIFEPNSELDLNIFVYELVRFDICSAMVVRLTDDISVFFAIFLIIERRQNIH